MTISPSGIWKTALKAQLAPIIDTDITARTEKMRADGFTLIWFSDRLRSPWLGPVPSVRVARVGGEEHLVVVEGLVKFDGHGWKPVRAPLPQFLAWVFAHRVTPHIPRTPLRCRQRPLATVWTAPYYITAKTTHLEEEEQRRCIHETRMAKLQREREEKREQIRARNAVTRAKALAEATPEQAAHTQPPSGKWPASSGRSHPRHLLALGPENVVGHCHVG